MEQYHAHIVITAAFLLNIFRHKKSHTVALCFLRTEKQQLRCILGRMIEYHPGDYFCKPFVYLLQIFELQTSLSNLVVPDPVKNGTVRLEDICLKPVNDRCGIMSPFGFFNEDLAVFNSKVIAYSPYSICISSKSLMASRWPCSRNMVQTYSHNNDSILLLLNEKRF